MTRFLCTVLLTALPVAGFSQDTPKDEPLIEGLDDLADGMQKLFESFTDEVTPLMEDLAEQLQGLNAYHPPEVLPNGDIIIRRKSPKELEETPKKDSDEVIDI